MDGLETDVHLVNKLYAFSHRISRGVFSSTSLCPAEAIVTLFTLVASFPTEFQLIGLSLTLTKLPCITARSIYIRLSTE